MAKPVYTLEGNANYAPWVVEVTAQNLISLPNSDNLVGIYTNGYQAIVSKDTEPGSRFLVFPAEVQLSDAFVSANNLYRHPEKNQNSDPDRKGYLEDNRRVRAITLRGNRSDALALSLTSLSYLGIVPTEYPALGESFDTVGGVEISRKYEPPLKPGSGAAMSGKTPAEKAWKRVDAKFLPEHPDTENWFRNEFKVPEDAWVTVTQKVHGCFTAGTRVLMWDGSCKKIRDIETGDVVVGYRGGIPVPSSVTAGAFSTGRTAVWQKVVFSQPVKGDNPTTVSTPEHRFWTVRGWVEARDLVPGTNVYYTKHQPSVTEIKRSVLTGLMLGDGSIGGGSRNSVEWSHKQEHGEYLEYVRALLGNLTGENVRRRTSGYGTPMLSARTKALATVREVIFPWENNRVPEDLHLDDLSLAIWYMDDGSLAHSEKQQDRALFATCRYTEEGVRNIARAMVRAGFENPVVYLTDGYWRIRLNKDDAERLFARIRMWVPPVMQYKLPVYHRGFFTPTETLDEVRPVTLLSRVVSNRTISPDEAGGYVTKWDIETETSNFVANRVLVHNSSIRMGHTIVKRKPTWKDRLAARFGVAVKETEFDFVFGSRKVIKDPHNPNQAHYYSYDLWSDEGSKYEHLIPKNVVLYGELIGWTKDGAPIQQNYTYDVPARETHLYVYRVSVVTEDGGQYDLSRRGLEEFCRLRGLNVVPLLWQGFKRDFVAEDWLDKVFHPTYSGAVPLSNKGTVDEGVVIQYEGVIPFNLKAKSPIFLRHETKILDTDAEVLS